MANWVDDDIGLIMLTMAFYALGYNNAWYCPEPLLSQLDRPLLTWE
ncbi:MAG: hypothetical protein IPJ29_03435 [Chitinophagaceae bacterium]|nr:hypothetical protein [Chitinophagaceae bacterium]